MKTAIVKLEIPELQVIEKSKAQQIKKTFEPMVEMLQDFESAYDEVLETSKEGVTRDVTMKAKRLRIDIAKVRIETGKLKDKQKEYIKLEDRAIMGVHNIIVWAVKEKEDVLKQIENHFEIQEQKRLEKLQSDRAEKLSKYVEDAYERDLSKMDEDVWIAYFEAKKREYNDRIEAERKAEEERIAKEKAEAKERERIRKENERLKKEAEEREKRAKIEAEKRAKLEAKRKAKEGAERRAYEAKLKAEREEKERIEREERARREKLEAELKAKEEAEEKRLAQIEADKQDELNKGDAAKVKDLLADLETLKMKYSFKSAKNQKMFNDVKILIDKLITHIK